MYLVEVLSLGVIRLKLVVTDGPRRRDTTVMAQLAEVALTQAEQGGAVELGIATDVVIGVGMKIVAILVAP